MKIHLKLIFSFALAILLPFAANAETIDFGYCGNLNPNKFFGFGNPIETNYGEAIEIPAETANSFIGCNITGINVGFGDAAKCEVEVFVSTNLRENPVYTQKAEVKPRQFTVVNLDTPFPITGETLFVGYRFVSTAMSDSPLAFDYDEANKSDYGNWVSIALYSSQFNSNWEHYYANYGNVCVRAVIEGNVSETLSASPTSVELPKLAKPGKPFTAKLTVHNNTASEINNIKVEWNAGSNNGNAEWNFKNPLPAGADGIAEIPMIADTKNEELPVWFKITQVNGKPNAATDILESHLCCTDNLVLRNVMIEKNTGTQCGYCPVAYYAFERMSEEVTDGSFIPVAVHNYSYGSDPMACESYRPWNDAYRGYGAPTATYSRDPNLDAYPVYEAVKDRYSYLHSVAPAELYLETTYTDNIADVTATVLFYKDLTGIDYGIGFVLVEDNVGPYTQANNYAGGSNPAGGFEDKPSRVSLIYNDVARQIFDWDGARGAIPADVKVGDKFHHNKALSLNKCNNLANVKVIAFMTDKSTGEIVNAIRVPLGQSVGIENVASVDTSIEVVCTGNTLSVSGDFVTADVLSLAGTNVATLKPGLSVDLPDGLFIVRTTDRNMAVRSFKIIAK